MKSETEDAEDKEMTIERMEIVNEGRKEEGKVEVEGANRDEEWKAKEMKRETKEVGNKEVTIETVELVVNEVEKTKRDEEWKEEMAKVKKNVGFEEDSEGKLEGVENQEWSKQENEESACKNRRLVDSDPSKKGMRLLATTQKHLKVCTNLCRVCCRFGWKINSNSFQVRQEADQRYLKSAQKMANRYNSKNKVRVFEVGEAVSVRIPLIDRTSSDLPRLPCIVVEVRGEARQLYRLRYTSNILWGRINRLLCNNMLLHPQM